jgi:hypothetical protein
MTGPNPHAPDQEVQEVAQAGIRGMISALKTEKFPPELMVNVALHILAVWVASSQTRSSASERADDIEDLVDTLPSVIDYQNDGYAPAWRSTRAASNIHAAHRIQNPCTHHRPSWSHWSDYSSDKTTTGRLRGVP